MTAKKTTARTSHAATVAGVTIDATAMYRMTLAAPVRAGGVWYRPANRNSQLRGDLLLQAAKEHPGAIIGVEAIEVAVDG